MGTARAATVATAIVFALGGCRAKAHIAAAPPARECSALAQCASLAAANEGKPVLVPSSATIKVLSGRIEPRDPSGLFTPKFASFELLDTTAHRSFTLNLFRHTPGDPPWACPANHVEATTRTPGGRSICFVHQATPFHDVDIRYRDDDVLYVFSWFDRAYAGADGPTSAVGRWAMQIVDSYTRSS